MICSVAPQTARSQSWTCSEGPIRADDQCGMLRRDTATGFTNLYVCRPLASRPSLSNRRGVSGDIIPDEGRPPRRPYLILALRKGFFNNDHQLSSIVRVIF